MGVSGDKIKSNDICVFIAPHIYNPGTALHVLECYRVCSCAVCVLQSLLLCRMPGWLCASCLVRVG
jgi:hypothetical protein